MSTCSLPDPVLCLTPLYPHRRQSLATPTLQGRTLPVQTSPATFTFYSLPLLSIGTHTLQTSKIALFGLISLSLFRDSYPMTESIDWNFVRSNFVQALVCIFYAAFIFSRFIFPGFHGKRLWHEFSLVP